MTRLGLYQDFQKIKMSVPETMFLTSLKGIKTIYPSSRLLQTMDLAEMEKVSKSGLMDHPVVDDYAPPNSLMAAVTDSGDETALKLIREGDINGALNRLDDLGIDTFDITFESKASIPRNPNPCGF
jgi:hypothetical protein